MTQLSIYTDQTYVSNIGQQFAWGYPSVAVKSTNASLCSTVFPSNGGIVYFSDEIQQIQEQFEISSMLQHPEMTLTLKKKGWKRHFRRHFFGSIAGFYLSKYLLYWLVKTLFPHICWVVCLCWSQKNCASPADLLWANWNTPGDQTWLTPHVIKHSHLIWIIG